MLQHNEALFFTSQEMYKLPSGELYAHAKNDALLSRDPRYATKNIKEKWTFLINQLAESLPTFAESDRPNGLLTEEVKSRLNQFKTQRNNTPVSSYNLSLEQCNHYFEDFLFLYTTEDPRFKLSNTSKKTLLTSVIRAMGVCETGINTEFYAALQEVQRDTDWGRSELSKARSECIRVLHKRYNTQYKSRLMNVHDYDHLVKRANKRHLGIEQKETILEIGTWLISSKSLDTCFDNNHQQIFQKYEHDAPQTLNTYVTNEITAILGTDRWQNNPALSPEDIAALGQVLGMHFEDARADQFMYQDYTEFRQDETGEFIVDSYGERDPFLSSIATQLKPRKEFDNAIKNLILQKMVADGYYVKIEDLIERPALRSGVILRNNITWDDLLAVYTAITNHQFDLIRDNAQDLRIIQTYPELIMPKIQNYPECLALLPNTHLHINKQVLTIFATILQREVETPQHTRRIRVLISQLVDFFEGDPEYLQQLPEHLLNHPEIGKAIVAKDGLLWTILSQTLKQDQEICQIAQEQNPDAIDYTSETARTAALERLLHRLPNTIRTEVRFQERGALALDASVRRLVRLKAYGILLTQDEIPVANFLKYAPNIRPDMLSKAIQYRKEQGLKPLPIVGQSSRTLATLAKFNREISIDFFNESSFKIRKLAETERVNHADNHHPWVYLAKNKNWIQGFQQYQAYQLGEGRRTVNCKALLLALGKAILCVLAIYLLMKMFLFVFPSVRLFASIYGRPLFLPWVISVVINQRLRSIALSTINIILINLVCLDFTHIAVYTIIMISLLCQTFIQLSTILHYAVQGVAAFMQSRAHEPSTHQNWLEQSEAVIARLALLDDPASHQKADILKQLKTKMSHEPDAALHPGLLNKRYDIIYQQKTYQISFAEVAACRREVDDEFSLEKSFGSVITFGLFHVPTSSERLLTDLIQAAQNEVVPGVR
ncbi:MAG: hypothetical protein NTU48_05990 [Legionellales bacterium]|nr:hypothetical protein [Legionellales bacterium]